MKKVITITWLLASSTYLSAQKAGNLTLNFQNYFGNEPVVLHSKNYTNNVGEQFNISLLQYYVSNFRLVKADGSEYIVPKDDCYFLIREDQPKSKAITLQNIPKGTYKSLQFMIGIDSTKSASNIAERKGCLDVAGDAKDMYWAWNSGYIFVKMEGVSPVVKENNSIYNYHIGFFGGIGDKRTINNIKISKIAFAGKGLKVKPKSKLAASIITDVSKILNGNTSISMAKNPSVMSGPLSSKIAENYKDMFTFGGLQ